MPRLLLFRISRRIHLVIFVVVTSDVTACLNGMHRPIEYERAGKSPTANLSRVDQTVQLSLSGIPLACLYVYRTI